MLIRGQTTEERIGQIADGFAKGISNFDQISQRNIARDKEEARYQEAKALQAEATRRQQALQAFEVSNKIASDTGRLVSPDAVAPMLNTGSLGGIGDIINAAPMSPKYERELQKAQRDQEEAIYKSNQRMLAPDQQDETKRAIAIAEARAKAAATFKTPKADPVTQSQMKKLGDSNAGLYNVKSAMDQALTILKDPKISQDQKIKTGQSLFKLLNSAEGSDAVGAEEAKRLGSYLEYNIGNVTQPGAFLGRDLGGFTDQVSNYSSLLGKRIGSNEQGINALRSGGSLGQASRQTVGQSENSAPAVIIQNGYTYNLNPLTGKYE